MGGGSKQEVPNAPEYQADPRISKGIDRLFELGNSLTSFDFSGDLAPLQDTISTSPEATSLMIQNLRSQLDPVFRDRRRSTVNELAANNQLESSVANSAFAQEDSDYQSSLLRSMTEFGISDINRALENRIRLFSEGASLLDRGIGRAGEESSRLNTFNLKNFENQLAVAELNAEPATGGWVGGLTGAIGGGLGGFDVGGPIGAGIGIMAGGAAGALGPAGTGGQLLRSGASFVGSGLSGGSTYTPRSTATNTLSGGNYRDLINYDSNYSSLTW